MNRAAIALLLGLALLASSCEVHEVTLERLEDLAIREIKPKEMLVDVTAELDNPNGFKINVKGSELDLYLEQIYLGKATLVNDITLEAKTKQTYQLSIRAESDRLQQQLMPIMLSAALTGKVTVRLSGQIEGKVFFMTRAVDVDIEEEVRFDQRQNG